MTDITKPFSQNTQTRETDYLHPEQRILVMLSTFMQQSRAADWFWLPTARQLHFGLFLALFYVIPNVVLWLTQWPNVYRHTLAGIAFAGLVLYAIRYRRAWRDLGFRLDNLKPALLWFGVPTLLLAALMPLARHYDLVRVSEQPLYTGWVLVYYFLVSGPVQEFAYRGVLFLEMKRSHIRHPWVQLLICGFLFATLHLHHRDLFTFISTFGIGVLWGWLYQKQPNWLAVSISHSILGVVAIITRMV